MKKPSEMKIAILGFGYLAGYIRPCYEGILGENMKTQMIATKGTDRGLAEKQKEFGFPILVGDSMGALKQLEPDLILVSTKPNQVPALVQDVLKPYYQSLRENGKPLPDMYSFAPDPAVTVLQDEIGLDVNICNVLPNMVDRIQGLYVAPIAYSFLTFDPRRQWPEENKQFVSDFLAPIGQVVFTTPETAIPVLASKIACHNVYELNFVISDVLNSRGMPITVNQTASAMRAFHRSRFDTFAPDRYHCSMGDVDKNILEFIKLCNQNWYDGIIDHCNDKGVDSYVSKRFVRGTMEMHLLTVQMESREALDHNNSVHATKGGVLEKAVTTFKAECWQPLADAFNRYLDGNLEPEFWSKWRQMAYDLTAVVCAHGSRLSK